MDKLLSELGINWKLLFTQAVNFSVLLTVLTFVVYRPLMKLMEDRRKRIEFGLRGADEAEQKLAEIENLKETALAEAEKSGIELVRKAEKSAQKKEKELVTLASQKAEGIIKEANLVAESQKQKGLTELSKEAVNIIRDALIKTVELEPKEIDNRLINKALESTRAEK